jgi:hypothetical protein
MNPMNMPKVTMIFGVVLVGLGLVSYLATGMVSVTALIPAFFGVVLILLGGLAANPARRKMIMHIAVVVGLLGVAGTFGGLIKLPTYFSGGELARPEAVLAQGIMCLLSLLYVALCVKSFVDARRNPA